MGVHIGAELAEDPKQIEEVFGADIRAAGVLPLQLIIENKGAQTIEIVAGQTCLIDDDNRYWRPLSTQAAAEKLDRAEPAAAVVQGKTVKTAKVSDAVMEMAVAMISRHGAQAPVSKPEPSAGPAKPQGEKQGAVDKPDKKRDKGIDGRIMTTGSLMRGYLYFPGDIRLARELRIQIKSRDDGRLQTFTLKLK